MEACYLKIGKFVKLVILELPFYAYEQSIKFVLVCIDLLLQRLFQRKLLLWLLNCLVFQSMSY